MNKQRLDYIDILKGIGILLVIFSHSGAENEITMMYVGGVFIPLFFIASGYTYTNRENAFVPLMLKRFRCLMVPYVFFSVLLLFLYKRFSFYDVLGIFYSRYCLYPYDNDDNMLLMGGGNSPLWFLTSMLSSFPAFYLLIKNTSKTYLILSAFIVYTWGCQYLPILLPWSFDIACLMACFMYIGVIMRKYDYLLPTHGLVYLFVLFIFLALCNINGGLNVSVREYGRSFLLYLSTGILGTAILLWLSKKIEKTPLRGLLVDLGRHSLFIFCSQMFLLRICHQVFHSMLHFPTEGILFYLITLIKILMVAILGMCISKDTNRYMPWLFK